MIYGLMVQLNKSDLMKLLSQKFLLIVFTFLSLGIHATGRNIPKFEGHWVIDETGKLSPQTIQELEGFLKFQRDSTSNQIAVYMINSLEGDDVDDYTFRVFKEWKIGQAGKDNGVLLLISLGDRAVRIEVGRGLEGVLTDLHSSRINRNELAPRFRQGDYDNGVKAAIIAITQVIKGEYTNDDPTPRRRSGKGKSPIFTVLMILALIIFMSRRRGGGGSGGYWAAGGLMGGMGSGGFGGGSGGGGSWGDFGGGGISGGGGSSDSW